MNIKVVEKTIIDYVDIEFNIAATESSHLQDHCGLDSLDMVELIIYLEQQLNCKIPDRNESVYQRQTIGELADCICNIVSYGKELL